MLQDVEDGEGVQVGEVGDVDVIPEAGAGADDDSVAVEE